VTNDERTTLAQFGAIGSIVALIISVIVWPVVHYNLETNKLLLENDYIEIAEPGSATKYWRKANVNPTCACSTKSDANAGNTYTTCTSCGANTTGSKTAVPNIQVEQENQKDRK
jgi:hypothetical protein